VSCFGPSFRQRYGGLESGQFTGVLSYGLPRLRHFSISLVCVAVRLLQVALSGKLVCL
jgi:hypothetical protein